MKQNAYKPKKMIRMKKLKIKELQEEIIGLKQLNEQLELARDKAEGFIEENYPATDNFKITQGWHSGCHTSTYRVTIEVYAEDLYKLVRMLTHRKLKDKKWSRIKHDIKEELKKEIEELHT